MANKKPEHLKKEVESALTATWNAREVFLQAKDTWNVHRCETTITRLKEILVAIQQHIEHEAKMDKIVDIMETPLK